MILAIETPYPIRVTGRCRWSPSRRDSRGQERVTRDRGNVLRAASAFKCLVLAIFATTIPAAEPLQPSKAPVECQLGGFAPGDVLRDPKDPRFRKEKPSVYEPSTKYTFLVVGLGQGTFRQFLETDLRGTILAVIREYDGNLVQQAYIALVAKYGEPTLPEPATPEATVRGVTGKLTTRAFWRNEQCGQGVQFIRQSKASAWGQGGFSGAVVVAALHDDLLD